MSNSTNKQRIEDVTARLISATLQLQNLPNLFKTEQEMRSSESTSELGDKAMIYKDVIGNCTESSVFNVAMFPETVTLTNIISENIMGSFNAIDTSMYVNLSIYLQSDTCSINISADMGYAQIDYTSLDGITYTRTTDIDSFDLRY